MLIILVYKDNKETVASTKLENNIFLLKFYLIFFSQLTKTNRYFVTLQSELKRIST